MAGRGPSAKRCPAIVTVDGLRSHSWCLRSLLAMFRFVQAEGRRRRTFRQCLKQGLQ